MFERIIFIQHYLYIDYLFIVFFTILQNLIR